MVRHPHIGDAQCRAFALFLMASLQRACRNEAQHIFECRGLNKIYSQLYPFYGMLLFYIITYKNFLQKTI